MPWLGKMFAQGSERALCCHQNLAVNLKLSQTKKLHKTLVAGTQKDNWVLFIALFNGLAKFIY